jgi:hypothetical protein
MKPSREPGVDGTTFAGREPLRLVPAGYVDMLFLRFKSSTASWTIGPADSIELRGADMLFPNRAEPVARFQDGWILDGRRCAYVECRSMLSIRFEDETGRSGHVIGLRTAFYLRGVYAFAGRERIAKLDPTAGTWFRTDKQEYWPRMQVVPAPY